MAHELWLLKGNTLTNITSIVGQIGWRSNIDELGDELTFTVAFTDATYAFENPCELGDVVILKNESEITRCVIVDENRNGRSPISYTAFDYAFYLNKSNAIYQFNKLSTDQAIRKMLKDFNIPIGNIVKIPTIVNKIFNDKVVSEIITELVESAETEQGTKYLMEMRQGKFYLEKRENTVVTGKFDMATNITGFDLTSVIMNPSRKRSIADMKNSIQIMSEEKLITTVQDQNLINKYGTLQQVVTIDKEVKGNAKRIAQSYLRELGKIVETNSVELFGNDEFRAGRLFSLTEEVTGMSGTYLIKSVDHSISNSVHTMKLDLEVT